MVAEGRDKRCTRCGRRASEGAEFSRAGTQRGRPNFRGYCTVGEAKAARKRRAAAAVRAPSKKVVDGVETRCCTRCGKTVEEGAVFGRAGRQSWCNGCDAEAKREDRRASRRDTDPPVDVASTLAPWADGFEREMLDEYVAAGGDMVAAAEKLGLTIGYVRGRLREIERRAAAKGWAPASDMTTPQPEGFTLKGVSTYYRVKEDGTKEPVGQWVKTKADEEAKLAALLEAVARIAEPFRGLIEPAAEPAVVDADLLCVYPFGDPHIGMLSWAEETGQNFDLKIAESTLVAAVDKLVEIAPPAEQALIIPLGDNVHSDNLINRTSRSHAALDVDGRWAKLLHVAIRTFRRCIDRALLKHKRVHVIVEIGNHDDQTAIVIALALELAYEKDPRVTVDTSPAKVHYYKFGKCLLGVTHGDTIKKEQLGPIMAVDRKEDWAATEHRRFYTGHIHHDTLREYPGLIVESFRTLAARDAWHAGQGYRSGQDMKCHVWHREDGLIDQHTVGIRAIWRRIAEQRLARMKGEAA